MQPVHQEPRRGRGRPKGTGVVDPDDILTATLDAIAEGGYGGMSVRGIARSLGVSLATVQHHFGTKAELWRAAVDHYFGAIEEHRSALPEADLVDRIRMALEVSSERPGFFAALLGDRSPGADQRLDHLAQRFRDLFTEPNRLLADLQERGHARQVDPDVVQVLVAIGVGSIAGAPDAVRTIYGFDLTSSAERDRLAVALADIIGNGLRAER